MEANGLDLSGFIIIVDSIAIKNSRYVQFVLHSLTRDCLNVRQGYVPIC